MPNWCNNTLTVNINPFADIDLGTKELQKFIQDHNCVYDSDGVEYPQELIRIPIDFTKENLPDINFSFSGSLPIPQNEENNWYKWCTENWGTKWDINEEEITYDISDTHIEYKFDTAWSPPNRWLETIHKNYPLLQFELISYESGCDFYIEISAGYENDEPYFHTNEMTYFEHLFGDETVKEHIKQLRDYLIINGKKIVEFMAYIEENRDLLDISFHRFIASYEETLQSKTINEELMLVIFEHRTTLEDIANEYNVPQELQGLLDILNELYEHKEEIEFYPTDLINKINICGIYSAVQKIEQGYKTALFRRFINSTIKKSRINRELIEFSMFHPNMLSTSIEEGWYNNLPFKLVHSNTNIYTHSGYLIRELEVNPSWTNISN